MRDIYKSLNFNIPKNFEVVLVHLTKDMHTGKPFPSAGRRRGRDDIVRQVMLELKK